MENREYIDVLTPIAACELFGKSTEAVRRATTENLVESPVALHFGAQPIHLLDLESALAYWAKRPRPAYFEPLQSAIDRMRGFGITFKDSGEIEHYRVLHPFKLTFDPRKCRPASSQ